MRENLRDGPGKNGFMFPDSHSGGGCFCDALKKLPPYGDKMRMASQKSWKVPDFFQARFLRRAHEHPSWDVWVGRHQRPAALTWRHKIM
jgi:hypothetical protein